MNQKLTSVLLDSGLLNKRDLVRAELVAAESGEPVQQVLCRLGLVAEEEVARGLAECLSLEVAKPKDYPKAAIFTDRLGADFLRAYRVLPLRDSGPVVSVAMADPLDGETRRALELQLGKAVQILVAVPGELDRRLEALYGVALPDAATFRG